MKKSNVTKLRKEQDLHKANWKKVVGPRRWSPTIGEQLVGYYVGKTKKSGSYGEYEAIQIKCADHGEIYLVSGTILIQLVDTAQLSTNDPIKIVYGGQKAVSGGRTCKMFELWVV